MNDQDRMDDSVLEGIPEELIRPLLAISIRATELHTAEDFERLFNDIEKISKQCSDAGGQSLYYVIVKNSATRRLNAALAAENWLKQTDATAKFGGIEVSRWSVYVATNEDTRKLFVSYKPAYLDPITMEEDIEFVVTEASKDEL